jgi:two-component system chemotaxis response regulator CheY
VVDDDAVSRLSVEAMVRTLGHDCRSAPDGRAAWDALQAEPFDVLITDRQMPYLDGLELCRLVRGQLATRHLYVVVVTGLGSTDQAREGMVAGADDYLTKPTQLIDVELRLIAAERVNRLHRELERASRELRAVARRDALTGLGNRRSLSDDLAVLVDRQRRYGREFSVALLDVDHFKSYNDRYGQQVGDEVLQSVAKVLIQSSRLGDTWYRYGGEQFLGIYPEQNVAGVLAGIERVREGVAALAVPHVESPSGLLTVSVGIADMNGDRVDEHGLVRAADEAMYSAKRRGRDRVEVAPPAPVRMVGVPAPRQVDVASSPQPSGEVEPNTDAPNAEQPPVDFVVLDAVLAQFGGHEPGLRESLLDSYLQQSGAQIAELVVAALDDDRGTVARLAHTVRSSSALLGATVLAQLLEEAEQVAVGGSADLTERGQRIQAEYERVAATMTELQAS